MVDKTMIKRLDWEQKNKITHVEIEHGVTQIDSRAFQGFPDLEYVNIPTSVTHIGSWAFSHCPKLKRVELHDGIQTILQSAFAESGLVTVSWPEKCSYVAQGMFKGCENLKSFSNKGPLRVIYKEAFSECVSLDIKTIEVEHYIGQNAFERCEKLQKLDITAPSIDESAFSNCTSLTDVTIRNCRNLWKQCFVRCNLNNVNIHTVTINYNANPWSRFDYDGQFSENQNLKEVSVFLELMKLPKVYKRECAIFTNYVYVNTSNIPITDLVIRSLHKTAVQSQNCKTLLRLCDLSLDEYDIDLTQVACVEDLHAKVSEIVDTDKFDLLGSIIWLGAPSD